MQSHQVHAVTYELRESLLPQLTSSLTGCGGWLLDRKHLSPAAMELLVEIQLRGILELYAALAATGIELTRTGRDTLAGLCNRSHHTRIRHLGEVVTIRLHLRFLEDAPLSPLLAPTTSIA